MTPTMVAEAPAEISDVIEEITVAKSMATGKPVLKKGDVLRAYCPFCEAYTVMEEQHFVRGSRIIIPGTKTEYRHPTTGLLACTEEGCPAKVHITYDKGGYFPIKSLELGQENS